MKEIRRPDLNLPLTNPLMQQHNIISYNQVIKPFLSTYRYFSPLNPLRNVLHPTCVTQFIYLNSRFVAKGRIFVELIRGLTVVLFSVADKMR